MANIGVLIFFAIVSAVICAKARVAGSAIVFSLVALVLFIGTPTGAGLPVAVAEFISSVNNAASPVLNRTQPTGAVG